MDIVDPGFAAPVLDNVHLDRAVDLVRQVCRIPSVLGDEGELAAFLAFVRKVALAGNQARATAQIRAALDAGADSVHVFPLGRDRMSTVRAFAQAWSAAVSPRHAGRQ